MIKAVKYTIRELKTWPGPFRDIKSGRKTFEYRRDDRHYEEGDDLLLREWSPDSGYTGDEILVSVPHLIRGPDFGIAPGFVCMSIKLRIWQCAICGGSVDLSNAVKPTVSFGGKRDIAGK